MVKEYCNNWILPLVNSSHLSYSYLHSSAPECPILGFLSHTRAEASHGILCQLTVRASASWFCLLTLFPSRFVKALVSLWCLVKESATGASIPNAWDWVHNPMGSSSAWSAKTVNEQVVSASLGAAAWNSSAATNIDCCLVSFRTRIHYLSCFSFLLAG